MPQICHACTKKSAGPAYCTQCGSKLDFAAGTRPPQGHRAAIIVSILTFAIAAITSPPIAERVVLALADPAMENLASRAGMNEAGKRLFLLARPVLSEDIALDCSDPFSFDETPAEDGCYFPNQIFLRDMPDEFEGYEVSTAAHEMLHAAYEQLGEDERGRIDGLLRAQAKSLKDKELKERLDMYEQYLPDSTNPELHSILPTEYPKLSPELEDYYRRYFENRQLAVKQNQIAEAKFKERETAIELLKKQIEAAERALTRAEMLQSIATYNNDKAKVSQYSASVAKAEKDQEALKKQLEDREAELENMSSRYAGFTPLEIDAQ